MKNWSLPSVFGFYTILCLLLWSVAISAFAYQLPLPTWEIGQIGSGPDAFTILELEPQSNKNRYLSVSGALKSNTGALRLVYGTCITWPQNFCELRTGGLVLYLRLDSDWNGSLELWDISAGESLGTVSADLREN